MSIASALGLAPKKKIRYAVVGLGDIAQEAMMPGIAHTGNSELTALVTSDPEKAKALAELYEVEHTYRYEEFDTLLASGHIDAIYLATPNWMHLEFIVPALKAGIHVLAEKPLEISVAKCREIIQAQQASTAKLMVAYRLHFEPNTMDALELIRSGDLGEVFLFSSVFSQPLDPANHRAHHGVQAGPLLDMAPYPINAARYVFGAEPTEVVSAVATRHPQSGLPADLDDTVSVTLRFPGNRIAQFTTSYFGSRVDTYHAVGTKGSLQMSPGFGFETALEQFITIGDKQSHKSRNLTDQFGGQMQYFSDCILEGRDPEPDGEEGLADMRVIEGILKAIESGTSQPLDDFHRSRRIDTEAQRKKLSTVKAPEPVNAASPAKKS